MHKVHFLHLFVLKHDPLVLAEFGLVHAEPSNAVIFQLVNLNPLPE